MLWLFSISTWALLGFLGVFIALIINDRKNNKKSKDSSKTAPGPRQWPIIGSIPYMAKYEDGSVAFANLAKEYGNVVTLKLGSVDTVVVSGLENFRQILITESHLFDARPNFPRYNMLFGQKDNSIAFCDWNALLKKRREIMTSHTFPRISTTFFDSLDDIATENILQFLDVIQFDLKAAPATNLRPANSVAIKPKLSKLMCKIFIKYFCSIDIDLENADFIKLVENMDMIFQEINQGCIGDLLPSLMPLINKQHLVEASHYMRWFVVKYCVEPRLALRKAKEEAQSSEKTPTDENNNVVEDGANNDLLDSFLNNLGCPEGLTLDNSLYALEDIIGGHAAISNTFIRILYHVAKAPKVQEKIRQEIQNNSSGFMKIGNKLPYTEATLWEAMRHISSPIVPHQTTEDAILEGYVVKKGTVVFFNNYDLHFSTKYWENPEEFIPEKFLVDGKVLKPDYFIPFSFGKRSCLGYKLVMNMSAILLANICLNFHIELDPTEDYKMAKGNIAVAGVGKRFIYRPIEC